MQAFQVLSEQLYPTDDSGFRRCLFVPHSPAKKKKIEVKADVAMLVPFLKKKFDELKTKSLRLD